VVILILKTKLICLGIQTQYTNITQRQTHNTQDKPNHYHSQLKTSKTAIKIINAITRDTGISPLQT